MPDDKVLIAHDEALRLAAMTDAWKNEMVAKQEALARERALREKCLEIMRVYHSSEQAWMLANQAINAASEVTP